MRTILVVDDEKFIADGLASMLGEAVGECEIDKAYSAIQALERFRTVMYDIVLTDIQMPGMTGLELHAEVKKLWPRCKFIYLTGYDDFSYAQTALRYEGSDYVLKTEGDRKIVAAVRKAIDAINRELEWAEWVNKAHEQIQTAIPLLQREYLTELLDADEDAIRTLGNQLAQLQIPLTSDLPVLLIVGRIDDWGDYTGSVDRSLMQYALQNIADEYLSPCANVYCIAYRKSQFIWFIQPLEDDWPRTVLFATEMFEQIQQAADKLLKLPLSIAAAQTPAAWRDIADKFMGLNRLFSLTMGHRAMVTEKHSMREQPMPIKTTDLILHKSALAERLEDAFWTGRKAVFNERLQSLLNVPFETEQAAASREELQVQVFYLLAALFIDLLHKSELKQPVSDKIDISLLMKSDSHGHWNRISQFFVELGEVIFQVQSEMSKQNEHQFVRRIHRFVEEQLSSDLSLTRIAQEFAFNRSYLSRLYSQLTGEGLSEYIAEQRLSKAKELLHTTLLKINEISAAVGLETPTFHRLFKKTTGMTPQEYRDASRS